MEETIEKAKSQFFGFWNGLDKKKKMRLIVSSLLLIVSMSAIIFFTTRTTYDVLYENLTLKDTGLITNKLDDMGIPWKSDSDNETTILVPKDMKSKVKIALASDGLPKDGYSILDAFNDSSWTMTEYEKKQRVAYALQNELSSTIAQIDGIRDATVYIDLTEDTAFVTDSGQATASVFVNLSGGMSLSSDKVQAIKNLVSSSFKNMSADNVTITDDTGKTYNNSNDSLAEYNLSEQLLIKQNFQAKLDQSIRGFLENLFGYNNVDVRTSAKVNFTSEVSRVVQFAPPIEGSDEGLIRSMEQIEENTVDGNNGGVVGVENNTNDATDYANADEYSTKYSKASKVINYELNEINKEIKKMPGEIESVTVAVLINEDAVVGGELTKEQKKEIEELIYATTGLETQKVIVSSGKFERSIVKENNLQSETQQNNTSTLLVLAGFGLFALLGITGVILYRRKKDTKENIQEIMEEKLTQSEAIDEIEFDKEKSEYKAQVNKFVDKQPESVAQLLRSWLNED